MIRPSLGGLLVLIACGLVASPASAIPPSERAVLQDLYTSTNGDGWHGKNNWNGEAGSECRWEGVGCNDEGTHVVKLDMNLYGSGNNLIGNLPASLRGLTELEYLDVSNNRLTSSIPSLQGMTKLRAFLGANNALTGPIPTLQGLTSLASFWVQNNQLTDRIPALQGLTNLRSFILRSNRLTGPIPSLQGLAALEHFQVDDNQLRGEVPMVPTPNNLAPHQSSLCPNYLLHRPDADWDAATVAPWYRDCTGLVFSDGFESPP